MSDIQKRFVLELTLKEFGMLSSLSALGVAALMNDNDLEPMLAASVRDFQAGIYTVEEWNTLTDRMMAMAVTAGGKFR